MALEATHIRIALDLKKTCDVKDVPRYVIGTIYPDSRYMTGIDRNATHPADHSNWKLDTLDDFKKGWLIHLLADAAQRQALEERMPAIFQGGLKSGNPAWIRFTAIKILQDLEDVKKFDLKSCLPYLEQIENPQVEKKEDMRKYHNTLQEMYAEPESVEIKTCCKMWAAFGINDAVVQQLKETAEAFQRDPATMAIVNELYDAIHQRVLKRLQTEFV